MSERLKQHSSALAGYLALAIIFSYPLILNFTTSILGPMEDNVGWLWYMWWVKRALVEGKSAFFFTDYLFYPKGMYLALNSFGYFKTILSIPFQYFFDLITVYNILTIFSYVFSGFGAYLLVEHLTERPGVGFVCGMIYTFAPYHVWQLDHHLDICTIEMIPFFILFFIRFYQNQNIKDLILSGIFFTLASLGTWYYMVFLLYFIIIFWGYFLYVEKEKAFSFLKKTIAMLIFSFLALLPFLYPLLEVKLSGQQFHQNPSSFNCVTDLAAVFVPSAKHPLANWLNISSFYENLPCFIWETHSFVGYTVLALAIYGFIKVKNKWTRFMALSAVIFWLFSLGNHLQWKGQIVLESIYLPYFWFVERIPMVNTIRSPSRFILLVILSLAVIYGYGLDFLTKALTKKYKSKIKIINPIVLSLAGLLIFFEYMPFPNTLLDVEKATQAKYLSRNLPGGDGEYAILELPLTNNYVFHSLTAHRQIRHHKKILGGYPSFLPIGAYDFINNSLLRTLLVTPDKVDLNYFKSLKSFLSENKIKYIILNRYITPNQQFINFLEHHLKQTFIPYGEPNPQVGIYQVY